eukprot:g1030.t1
MRLPLRLWALKEMLEAPPIQGLERAAVLDAAGVDGMCIVIDDSPKLLRAIIIMQEEEEEEEEQEVGRDALSEKLGIPARNIPEHVLMRPKEEAAAGRWRKIDAVDGVQSSGDVPEVWKLIVHSIKAYHTIQCMEPSTKGFLKILSKQFPRNELYIFELLQNAVDDGALTVEARCSENDGSLVFRHDGRAFNALDVLGLSSVGLSTKGRRERRTVGYMGIGFKAVFRRFSRVLVRSGRSLAFTFSKPTDALDYSWVLLPSFTDISRDEAVTAARSEWCTFKMSGAGRSAVLRDLRFLPPSSVPLLAMKAIRKPEAIFRLTMHDLMYSVKSRKEAEIGGGKSMIVSCSNKRRDSRWVFISETFSPSPRARQAFREHTFKDSPHSEQVLLFFQVEPEESNLIPVTSAGKVHAVLPTRLALPFAMHVQGTWLLSVDRRDMQSQFENAWNAELLRTMPRLLEKYLRWAVANVPKRQEALALAYGMLPDFEEEEEEEEEGQDKLSITCLGVRLATPDIERAVLQSKLCPVLPLGTFSRTQDCVFISLDVLDAIGHETASRWLGGKACADVRSLGTAAENKLWRTASCLSEIAVPKLRDSVIQSEVFCDVEMSLKFFEGLAEAKDHRNGLPLSRWILPAGNHGQPIRIHQACWIENKFFDLDVELAKALEAFVAEQHRKGRGKKPRRAVQIEFMRAVHDKGSAQLKKCLLETLPQSGLEEIFHRYLSFIHANGAAKTNVENIISLTKYCSAHGLHVEYVLCRGKEGSLTLVKSETAYIREPNLDTLSALMTRPLQFVATDAYSISLPLLMRCARLRRGIKLRASRQRAPSKPGLKLRRTKKSCPLPYELGNITDKDGCISIDFDFAPEWTSMLARLAKEEEPAWDAFVELVVDMAADGIDVHTEPVLSEKTCPEYRHSLRGTADTTDSMNHRIAAIKRLVYLEPGKCGITANMLSLAKWVVRLKGSRWIPIGNSKLARPSQCLLKEDPLRSHLPLALMNAKAIQVLRSNQEFCKMLEFGTAAAPSPAERWQNVCSHIRPDGRFAADSGIDRQDVIEALDALVDDISINMPEGAKKRRAMLDLIKTCRKSKVLPGPFAGSPCVNAARYTDCSKECDKKVLQLLRDEMISQGFLVDACAVLRNGRLLSKMLQNSTNPSHRQCADFLTFSEGRIFKDPAERNRAMESFYIALRLASGSPQRSGFKVQNLSLLCTLCGSKDNWHWVSMEQAQGRFFFADDEQKLAHLNPILLENGFLRVFLLPSFSPARRLQRTALEKCGVPFLSSPREFSVQADVGVERGDAMESESARLAMALNFVPQYAQRETAVPKLLRVAKVCKVLRALQFSSTLDCWAAMGTVFPHFFVRGDNEDFVSDLQVELETFLQQQLPAKVSNLLRFLSDGQKFAKFMQRDFNVTMPMQTVPRPPDALPPIPPPPPPPPPPVTAASSDTLVASASIGMGRGIRNTPAWMQQSQSLSKESSSSVVAAAEGGEIVQGIAPEVENGDATASSDIAPKGVAVDERLNIGAEAGHGRGMNNRPAWMNTLGKEGTAPEIRTTCSADGDASAPDPQGVAADDGSSTVASMGRGRGMNNEPAWMANAAPGKSVEKNASTQEADDGPSSEPAVQAPVSEPQGLADPSTVHAGLLATGRGRGVSNQPAWMTATAPVSDASKKRGSEAMDPLFKKAANSQDEETSKKRKVEKEVDACGVPHVKEGLPQLQATYTEGGSLSICWRANGESSWEQAPEKALQGQTSKLKSCLQRVLLDSV